MAEIRALERADVPAVAALLHADLGTLVEHVQPRHGTDTSTPPEEQISRFLAATLIDDPWRDEELPSLVATDDGGEVIGFVGAQVRRFRFEDRTLRGVCATHLTVAADRRGGAAGALLLRRLLTGEQDFSFSDTANDAVARIWQTLGGHLDHARACDWMVVLRPIRWVRSLGAGAVRRRLRSEEIPVGALPFQAVRRGSGRWAFPHPEPNVTGEEVDSATIVEHLPEMTREFRLWGDYDEQFLDHVTSQARSRFGGLVCRLVRRGDRAVGWYAYAPDPGSVSRILHLLTSDRDADVVLGDLVAHAREQGSAVLTGRHEPHLTLPLQQRLPVLGFARRPVIHCHDPEILATVATGKSLLTQLDGEWFVT